MRKKFADIGAALPVLLELKWRWKDLIADVENGRRSLQWNRLPSFLCQPRLGVEGVHLGRTTIHEEEDHRGGFRRVVGRPLGERVCPCCIEFLCQESGKCKASKSIRATAEHLAATDSRIRQIHSVHISLISIED